MRTNYGKIFSQRETAQSAPIPGSAQVQNSAGGYAWQIDDWARLDRFLILGSEGGSYYASERALSIDNAEAVTRCLTADGPRTVARVVEISHSGRAPKNGPAIFALAMAAKLGDPQTRKLAYAAVPRVCRIGTHLMHFAEYAQAFGGWGRGMRRAVGNWYNERSVERLAYQMLKYRARDGWSNRDLLRLAHPKAPTEGHQQLYRWATKGIWSGSDLADLALIDAFERAKRVSRVEDIIQLIQTHGLPREGIPTRWLVHPGVWDALLVKMPMTAMIRNLATMTRVGLLTTMSEATRTVLSRLGDDNRLRKARVHPIGVLAALMTYRAGHGARGRHSWKPIGRIVDALDGAFYKSFGAVEPTGKRTLLGLDVSGSMTCGQIAGVPGLTPRVASAAMALITANVEDRYGFVAFTGGDWSAKKASVGKSLRELDITPRQRLDDVMRRVDRLPFGATDCALPMLWALSKRVPVETFIIYTDSETWVGHIHPAQALQKYRREMGIAAKLIVVGMVSNGFTIADPQDPGMLDVVGFDTATPAVMSDFARA